MVSNRRTTREVTKEINKKFDQIFMRDGMNSKPMVCIVCDQFINPRDLEQLTVTTLQKNGNLLIPELWNSVSGELSACYTYTGDIGSYEETTTEVMPQIGSMLLSPRSSFLVPKDGRSASGFSCCCNCNISLKKGLMPKYAIANNYTFGTPPKCLLDLTEVEIALLTPVKTYGYCFSYTGGKQKQLKGTLAYYKVQMKSIAQAAMHLDVLGLNKHIVVLMYGKMTSSQQAIARKQSKIRTEYVLKALQWLVVNNEEWVEKRINLNEIREHLVDPVILDNSISIADSESNNNIETTESFQVFFPDGTMSSATGGQESLDKYTELLQAASSNGYDIGFKTNLMKEAVSDFKDNNLVNACLLQFPYGRGGMHEQRLNGNGSSTCRIDIEEYVQHLSRISQRHFHHELFCLILYNIAMKQAMVRNAGWKVRNKCDAKALAEELRMEDVTEAINLRLRGGRKRDRGEGSKLLSAVDALAKAVPHTNEAAKVARSNGETIQHHFGTPSIFLTVTPDDDNSLLMQVLTRDEVDNDTAVKLMTDVELLTNARKRTELRIHYPGISALCFEYILDIIIEDVVGWDLKKGKAIPDKPGLFGTPEAFTVTVEEQGRRTLHTHIQVWLKEFNVKREELHSNMRHIQRNAEKEITQFVDCISKCRTFFCEDGVKKSPSVVSNAFEHECSFKDKNKRNYPVLVDEQRLRNLRQKTKMSEGKDNIVAFCPHCPQQWSSDELMESYLKHAAKVEGLTSFPDTEVRRLKSMAIEYQKSEGNSCNMMQCVIDAAYNHHSHTKSCFERHNSKESERDDCVECRYRYPQRMQHKTVVQNASEKAISWYSWDGSKKERFIKEICPCRGPYDVFQNVNCPAVSYSKLTCNTNVAVVMPGPVGQYSFKYNLKGTQKDDTKEYGGVKDAMQRILSKIRTYQSDRSEAVKRLLAASFAHQRTNVVGAVMASYLTRHKSRFLFSHKMAWCPLRDMQSLLDGGEANVIIREHNKVPFFQCAALHYLCRPSLLENQSCYDFYRRYEVIRSTKKNRDQLLPFHNSDSFKHPSYRSKNGTFLQGVRERDSVHLLKVFQYEFPDTAEFGGFLLDDNFQVNSIMEEYSKLVLMLFVPFREKSDIMKDSSFTLRLREAFKAGEITLEAQQFLQNLQDTRSNSFRVSKIEDDLQRRTELKLDMKEDDIVSQTSDSADEIQGECIDRLLQFLEDEHAHEEDDNDYDGKHWKTPVSLNLAAIRSKGSEHCGYRDLTDMAIKGGNRSENVIQVEEAETVMLDEVDAATGNEQDESMVTSIPTQKDIVMVLLSKTRSRRRTFKEITNNNESVSVLQANGSARSIIDWARKAKLDREQRRAFEIMTGTFILSFYDNPADSCDSIRGQRHSFVIEKRKLMDLCKCKNRKSNQLILFLHGPGGSGKTTVIDLVRTYAEEYCSYLENFEYSPRTIMVTAMTGVAATILLGETTHSALYLNQKRPIEPQQVEFWASTRLLIIDEISFASREDFENIHRKLRRLKEQLHEHYGGLNMVFSGDMRQLEPVGAGKRPVYMENCPEFRDWVNCYIELNGMHRFSSDMEWGRLLRRFRNGTMSRQDIDIVNERVVKPGCKLPEDIKYCTYFNRDRDSINTALFEERCKLVKDRNGTVNDSVLIFSDNVYVQDGSKKYVKLKSCKSFWENCGEDSVKVASAQGRMDPVLKLYNNCRVMLTRNTSVRDGQANGTQATVERVVLRHGVEPRQVMISGYIHVPAVTASQVSHVLLRHSNKRIQPLTFKVVPKKNSFSAKLLKPRALQVKGKEREIAKMRATQIPVVVNNATTGHKLQGSSVDQLFVHNWSYVTNWVYVVLSRVRTRTGLFSRKPISTDLKKYAVPEELKKMIRNFSNRMPTYWTEEDYEEIFDL